MFLCSVMFFKLQLDRPQTKSIVTAVAMMTYLSDKNYIVRMWVIEGWMDIRDGDIFPCICLSLFLCLWSACCFSYTQVTSSLIVSRNLSRRYIYCHDDYYRAEATSQQTPKMNCANSSCETRQTSCINLVTIHT